MPSPPDNRSWDGFLGGGYEPDDLQADDIVSGVSIQVLNDHRTIAERAQFSKTELGELHMALHQLIDLHKKKTDVRKDGPPAQPVGDLEASILHLNTLAVKVTQRT